MQQSTALDARNQLQHEGEAITVTFIRTSPTSGTIVWTLPTAYKIYNGALVTLSRAEHNPSNFPTDGETYTGSTAWDAPVDMIGTAHVIGAYYNNVTTLTVSVTGLEASDVYYAAVHLVTNTKHYYTPGSYSYSATVRPDAYAKAIEQSYVAPTSPTLGQLYYDLNSTTLLRWDGAVWVPVEEKTLPTGNVDPSAGSFVGDQFYNTRQRMLKVWNGTAWVAGEIDDPTPTTERFNVGTDLTTDERNNLIDILKTQMGAPTVCVELTPKHYHLAITNAIQEFRRRADNAYHRQFIAMTFRPGQSVYYLNDPVTGTNRVVDVLKIHRLNILGMAMTGNNGIYAQQFLQMYFQPGPQVDLVSVHLIAQLSETFSQLFIGDVAFNWRETTRELTLYRRIFADERFLIECSMEKTEQELLTDRWAAQWIQHWAMSESLGMLSRIRGKYGTLPGPGGGLTLNAAELYSESETLRTECLREIQDMEVGNGTGEFGNYSFIIG